jgi:protein-tyrosine phosphatase
MGAYMTTANRRLPLADASNLRDLGGYHTADGATMRWGRVFRSNNLAGVDPAGLARLGIRTICDFRNDEERASSPTMLPAAAPPALRLLPIVVGGPASNALRSSGATVAEIRAVLAAVYRALVVEHAGAYRSLFDHLVNDTDVPLVFHCTAGKDRTGVAAALVLTAVGVSRDDVVEDYLLTNECWAPPATLLPELEGEVRQAVLGAEAAYLDAAFDTLAVEFGGAARYLELALGLTPSRREQLRANLLA